MAMISIESENNNCLFFFYFFIGCYIICVIFLIYTLIRLLKYYFNQRRIHALLDQSLPTTVVVKIENINEQDLRMMKDERDLFQPLIIKTHEFSAQNLFNEPPPDYREHV